MLNVFDFVTDSNLYKKFEVDDLLFVEYKCLFPEDKVAYWTSSNYFIYVLGGRKRYACGNQEYLVEPGHSIFVKRGVYVAERFDKEDFCALIIFVPDHFIESVTRKYGRVTHHARTRDEIDSVIPMQMDAAFSSYFQSVLSYFHKSVSPPRELLVIKFEELILNILASEDNQELCSYLLSIRESDKVSIREIMEKNFMHPLSLAEYARLCARSLSAFKIDFQETFKTSPGKWLMARRLEHARLLIETTDEPILEVAAGAGFKNTSHFVRTFKEAFGKSPLQHRRGLAVQVS